MIRRPPRSTRTDTLFPYTTLFRSLVEEGLPRGAGKGRLQSVVVRHEIHKPSRVLLAQGGLQREIPQVQEVQHAGEAAMRILDQVLVVDGDQRMPLEPPVAVDLPLPGLAETLFELACEALPGIASVQPGNDLPSATTLGCESSRKTSMLEPVRERESTMNFVKPVWPTALRSLKPSDRRDRKRGG